MTAARPKAVGAMSFEEALAALETVVDQLEGGKVPLEESIALYERGTALRARCQTLLDDAELKVSRIVQGADGTVGLGPEAPAPEAPAPEAPAPAARPGRSAGGDEDIPF